MAKKETKLQNAEVIKLLKKIGDLEKIIAKSQKTEELLKKTQQDLNIRNESLAAINTLADRIYRSLDYNTVIQEAIAAMVHYGKTSTVTMLEYNEDLNCLVLLNSSDKLKGAESVRLAQKLFIGKSLAGEAYLKKSIVICEDIATDDRIKPEIRKALIKEGKKSVLAIPLLFQDHAYGVMNLIFSEKLIFTNSELETLLSIGKTIGLAMANARHVAQIEAEIAVRKKAERELDYRNNALHTINTVANKLYQSFDLQMIAKEAVESIALYTNSPRAALFELDEKNKKLNLLYGRGFNAATIKAGSVLSLESSFSGVVARSKQIVSSDDIARDKSIVPVVKKLLLKDKLTMAIGIPLLFQDKVLGEMNLFFRKDEHGKLEDYEREIFLSIGKTIGLAMANARNIEKIKAEIEERKKAQEAMAQSIAALKIINTVADKIYRSFDYKTLTKEAIAAMIQYGKTPTISMFEYDEAEKCLIMIDHSESVNGTESLALTPKLYLDKSAAGRAVLEKRIVLSPDIATDQRILPATRKALLKEGRKSALFIPLLFQNRVLGVMNLMFTQKYSFADYEIETLFSIGKTIGLAMANAKYIEQIKADVEERIIAQVALHKTEQSLSESQQNAKISNESLKIINAVADRIYLAHDYDALVQEAMEAVKLYGKTSAVVMFECNEDENTIALLSTSAEPKEFKATTVRLTSTLLPKSLTAQTIHEKRIIICEDAANDERINPEIKKMLIQYNLTYAISIPLLFRDKTLGVINLFFTEKYNFTDYELETLLSIGKTIGMAMANARNIEQIKAEIEERKKAQESMARSIASLQAVNTIADKVYGALDYDTLTRQAMSAISSYGNTSEVSMYEYHEDSDMLTVIGISIGELSDEVEAVRLGRKLSAKESIGGAAIHEKNIIVCTNIPDDQRIRADIKAAIIKDGHKAVISLPLLFQKRAMGVMNLFFNEAVNFNDYQLDTLFSIGKTIGLAMANARHIQQIKAEVEDRKIAQEALRQSEGKYRLLIENASDAIFIGQKGFITYANSRALELLGYTMEELTQKPIASYLIDETEKSKRKKTGMKSAYGIESFILINKKNEELSLDVHIIDIVWENKEASLYFGRDVTGQEKMEAQLYQAQKMEAIGTLAGGLAHDFNNLLMGIEGNTSLMLLQIPVSHPHYERLKNIEHYVTNGAEITAQLLGFARGGKYEVIPININKLIEKSASMFGRTKKEISIHENFGKNIWAVEVDRGQIEQVLLNLFVNAWQAMPGGGNMYLLTANQEMDENLAGIHGIKSGRYVKISVTDDGMGMDEETQRRLFDPFFTTKVRGRGTGLGLPSAYGIIKNHGGVITVYSEKNRGTTFNLYLPASGKEVAEEDTIAEDSLYAGKETILFVDDEEMIVDVGRDMLESMGYTVITARSGKAALEIYAEKMNNIDLVILDLIMPELGGEATFEKLKEINPGVKVLLSSGYSISGLANKLLSLGCRGFIQKPYSIKEFSARIRETLDMK